jgi:hypothetical protein
MPVIFDTKCNFCSTNSVLGGTERYKFFGYTLTRGRFVRGGQLCIRRGGNRGRRVNLPRQLSDASFFVVAKDIEHFDKLRPPRVSRLVGALCGHEAEEEGQVASYTAVEDGVVAFL